jgi:hypothetical protein
VHLPLQSLSPCVDCIDEVQEEKQEDERGEEELEEEWRLRMEALAFAHASCPHATDTDPQIGCADNAAAPLAGKCWIPRR